MGRGLASLAPRVSKARVLLFAKAPIAGRVKTRLIPALGADGAAALAARMLEQTISEALAARVGPVELCAEPDPSHPDWAGHVPAGVLLSAQGPGDLGERMARAASRILATGEPVLLIGSDCPELDRVRIAAAADALDGHDAILHPAADGGYALLGLSRFDPSLFAGIAWSSATVAAATIERLDRLGWRTRIGATLRDVDEPGDLL